MKEYREFKISGQTDQLKATMAEVEKSLNDGWNRNPKVENENRPHTGLREDEMRFCFECTSTESRKGALLVMMSAPDGKLSLSNIVPEKLGRLTYDEFNYILQEFVQRFVEPAAEKTGAVIETTSGDVTIDDWFTQETADKLRRFLKVSHGSTTQFDERERWMNFLVAAHHEGATVHGDVLRRWLEEEAHLDEYFARELANEYQHSQELLEYEEQLQGA